MNIDEVSECVKIIYNLNEDYLLKNGIEKLAFIAEGTLSPRIFVKYIDKKEPLIINSYDDFFKFLENISVI
jgi:hypothetical protein